MATPTVCVIEACPSYPHGAEGASRDARHECLPSEMRCAYCGVRIEPMTCQVCGRFMTTQEMVEQAGGDRPSSCNRCHEIL
jgi:hypothetical protein